MISHSRSSSSTATRAAAYSASQARPLLLVANKVREGGIVQAGMQPTCPFYRAWPRPVSLWGARLSSVSVRGG